MGFFDIFKGKGVKLPEETFREKENEEKGETSESVFDIEKAEPIKFNEEGEGDLVDFFSIQKQAEQRTAQIVATIEKGESGFKASDEVREKLKELKDLARAAKEGVLEKISEQLGSNEGGWYKDKESGKKYYIKFYKNPDQARVEFIANAIYEKLGINAVRSQLVEMNGKLAIASEAVPGAKDISLEKKKSSSGVRNGFVADAYLANWDVVGYVGDNIVQNKDGEMVRIDSGGALTFTGMGEAKEFPSDRVDELKNMLRPEYLGGQIFAGITEGEIRSQAQELVDKLKNEDIDGVLKEAGLSGDTLKKVRDGLKGRREFLIEHFNLAEATPSVEESKPTERIPRAIEELKKERESLEGVEMRPRIGLLADSDKIENQTIDVIDASDEGQAEINFKFTEKQLEVILEKIKKMRPGGAVGEGVIKYGTGDKQFELVKAWELQKDGIIIRISQGKNKGGKEVRSSFGLVDIRIPQGGQGLDAAEIGRKINELFIDFFEVPEGLTVPDAEAEKSYKLARYAWHHKLDVGDRSVDWESVEERLSRQEVVPGYHTMVESGKHKEYEDKHSPCTVFHSIGDLGVVSKILKVGGLFSTHERYRRGLLLSGWSSEKDLEEGGGDSVFTRLLSEDGIKASRDRQLAEFMGSSAFLVFNPRVLDRTDSYAYEQDRYGSTKPTFFDERLSPEELLAKQKEWTSQSFGSSDNELVFRLGISLRDIEAIACPYDAETGWQAIVRSGLGEAGIDKINGSPVEEIISQGAEATRIALEKAGVNSFYDRSVGLIIGEGDARDKILKLLRDQGIKEINGKPVEQFVVYAQKTSDLIDLSHGTEARSMRKGEVSEEEAFTMDDLGRKAA